MSYDSWHDRPFLSKAGHVLLGTSALAWVATAGSTFFESTEHATDELALAAIVATVLWGFVYGKRIKEFARSQPSRGNPTGLRTT